MKREIVRFVFASLPRVCCLAPMARCVLVICLSAGILVGCSSKEKAYIEEPVEKLYNQGLDQMQSRMYSDAVESFDEVRVFDVATEVLALRDGNAMLLLRKLLSTTQLCKGRCG